MLWSSRLAVEARRVLQSLSMNWNQKEVNGTFTAISELQVNYLLMMFYTTIGGWMLAYFVKMVKGDFVGADTKAGGGDFLEN